MVALVLPWALTDSPELITLATNILILSMLAISFDLCWGYSGIMSFGQALFFGVASYVVALVGRDLDFSQMVVTLPLAMLVGFALSLLFAFFLLLGRRTPTVIFVSLGTLAGAYAAERLVSGWQYVGAGNGLSSVKLMQFGSYEFVEGLDFYFVVLGLLIAAYGTCRLVVRSQFGLVLAGMRQNEQRLSFFGYRVQWYKATAFALAGTIAGLAGALFAYHQGFTGPGNLGPGLSTMAVLYCLFGGAGTLIGPVLGAASIESISYYLSGSEAVKQYWPVLLGILLLVVVTFKPSGLLGFIVSRRERIGAFGRSR
ncbi:MAG: branched-chain amino acid ABC transporter permease [Burkholderiaceae bacterium]